MEWYTAFTPPFTRPLGDDESLTVQIMEAECRGMHLIVRASVYSGTGPDARVVHGATLKISATPEVRRYAMTVAARVLRQREDKDPEPDFVKALGERLQHELEAIAEQVRAEGEKQHRQKIEDLLKPPPPPTQDEMDALYAQAREIAEDPYLWTRIDGAMARYVVGETQNRKLLYLVFSSRVLARPINAVVKGLSSAGKSHLCLTVKRFFPEDAIYDFTSMSDRFLLYCPYDLRHRFILLLEASGMKSEGIAATIMRTLLSEGFIRYGTVSGGKGYVHPQNGPTGFVSTTTSAALEFQMENRVLSPQIDDSAAQTHEITMQQAREAAGLVDPPESLEPFLAFQRWIVASGVTDARVPFAVQLAERMPSYNARMRRDFLSVLGLIKTSAIIHQTHRNKVTNACVEATAEDYKVAYETITTPFSVAQSGVTPRDRMVVAALQTLTKTSSEEPVTMKILAKAVGITPQGVERHVRRLIRLGYIENNGTSRSANLCLGEPLPDQEILPDPKEVTSWLT